MPHSSMSLQQLCRYLHLSEPQLRKLVDRGAIPSRRVNGELVFSRDEVHRWLEGRIGTSDDAELAQVEGALERSAQPEEAESDFRVERLFPDGAIRVPLGAKTRDSAIRSMVALAMETGLLWDAEEMSAAVKEREELHTTALDNGVALLHPRRPLGSILGANFIVMGMQPQGLPFGGGFGNLTDIFFLICSLDDRSHLRTLARLSRILAAPRFLETLRGLTTEQEIRELLTSTDESIS